MTPQNECAAYAHHTLAGIRANLSQDIGRYLTKSPDNVARGDTFKTRVSAFLTPELLCLFLHRVAHYLYLNGWRRAAVLLSRGNTMLHRISITPQSCIGPACRLPHPAGVTFHGRAGSGLTIYSLGVCCAHPSSWGGPVECGPRLGDDVTIAGHVVVLGPISIGDRCKVGFSVRLDEDAPPGVLVVSRALRQTVRPLAAGKAAAGR